MLNFFLHRLKAAFTSAVHADIALAANRLGKGSCGPEDGGAMLIKTVLICKFTRHRKIKLYQAMRVP